MVIEIPAIIVSFNALLSSSSTIILTCLVIYGIRHIGRAIKKAGEGMPVWIDLYFKRRENLLRIERALGK